jgi:hypothetical protein
MPHRTLLLAEPPPLATLLLISDTSTTGFPSIILRQRRPSLSGCPAALSCFALRTDELSCFTHHGRAYMFELLWRGRAETHRARSPLLSSAPVAAPTALLNADETTDPPLEFNNCGKSGRISAPPVLGASERRCQLHGREMLFQQGHFPACRPRAALNDKKIPITGAQPRSHKSQVRLGERHFEHVVLHHSDGIKPSR